MYRFSACSAYPEGNLGKEFSLQSEGSSSRRRETKVIEIVFLLSALSGDISVQIYGLVSQSFCLYGIFCISLC